MEYTRKLRMILKSVLNVKDDTTAIGVLAISVLRYCFRVIRCRLEGTTNKKVKVKDSRNRPGVAHRVPGSLGPQISMTVGT
jgi:hypothetical protein